MISYLKDYFKVDSLAQLLANKLFHNNKNYQENVTVTNVYLATRLSLGESENNHIFYFLFQLNIPGGLLA